MRPRRHADFPRCADIVVLSFKLQVVVEDLDAPVAAVADIDVALQINGKTRGSFTAPAGAGKDELEKAARAAPEAKKWLEGKEIKRIVTIPGRLVNIVAI